MLKFRSKYTVLGAFVSLVSSPVFAASTVGEVAENLISGTDTLTKMMLTICVIVGVGFMCVAMALYRTHRINPKFVPLDKPVLYLILGAALCCVPFLGNIFGGTYNSMDHKRQQSQRFSVYDIDAPLEVSQK